MALIVGAAKMTANPVPETGDLLLSASYGKDERDINGASLACSAGSRRTISNGTATAARNSLGLPQKNHRNGVANPCARMRRAFVFAFCNTVSDKNPFAADPLRRTDCSLIADGAAALGAADDKTASAAARAPTGSGGGPRMPGPTRPGNLAQDTGRAGDQAAQGALQSPTPRPRVRRENGRSAVRRSRGGVAQAGGAAARRRPRGRDHLL